jgi:cholesterol transport system auxiliary component
MKVRRPLAVHGIGTLAAAWGLSALTGCGSFFESTIPAPQAYVLRLPPPAGRAEGAAAGSVRVQRPEAGPGLDSDRIALLRSDRRFDFYAASRWAAPAPDLMESVLVDQLRASGAFTAVFEDTSPYPPRYNLRCSLARFESDYSGTGPAPVIEVALDCTFGRHRDRALLANFTARGSARAGDNRLGAVVPAFESATAQAVAELEKEIAAALAAETPPPAAQQGGG